MAFTVGIMNGNPSDLNVLVEEFEISKENVGQQVVKRTTIPSGGAENVVADEDTNRVTLTIPQAEARIDQPMVMTLDNPNADGLRVVYGDAHTHSMEELIIEPGETLPITADPSWKVEVSLLGVPSNAPSLEDQQGNA